MIGSLCIRPGGPADAEALAAIFRAAVWQGAAGFYSEAARDAWIARCPDAPAWAARVGGLELFLAEQDGRPEGFAARDGQMFDLLYVDPARTRCGIASALHARILVTAREAGIGTLRTHASDAALPFFTAQGWHVLQRQQVLCGTEWLQNSLMVRMTAPELPKGFASA